jgi:hypothetical protein
MKRIRCEGCGQKVLEKALTRATWIKSAVGAPRWCADCVLADPPPRSMVVDLTRGSQRTTPTTRP